MAAKTIYDFQYLNPVNFLPPVLESNNGSRDNAVAGLDFKANIAHRLQIYGQFLLDEFILKNIKNDSPTSWTNKFGHTGLGIKYLRMLLVLRNLGYTGRNKQGKAIHLFARRLCRQTTPITTSRWRTRLGPTSRSLLP